MPMWACSGSATPSARSTGMFIFDGDRMKASGVSTRMPMFTVWYTFVERAPSSAAMREKFFDGAAALRSAGEAARPRIRRDAIFPTTERQMADLVLGES